MAPTKWKLKLSQRKTPQNISVPLRNLAEFSKKNDFISPIFSHLNRAENLGVPIVPKKTKKILRKFYLEKYFLDQFSCGKAATRLQGYGEF
jgi:hypothetical protein